MAGGLPSEPDGPRPPPTETPADRERRILDALWLATERAAGDPWQQSGGMPSGSGGYGVTVERDAVGA